VKFEISSDITTVEEDITSLIESTEEALRAEEFILLPIPL